MGSLKISVHPLFFIFGLYFAFTGKVFSFIVFTLTAVIHELGHSFKSEQLGYKLNKIVLMPYGAIIKGDTESLKYKDECLIALFGPLTNFVVALLFVALWWLIPEIYPYTDVCVMANFSIAIINLLPCFPLDGGRVLLSTLSLFISRKRANLTVRILGLILGLILLGLFIYSVFTTLNLTLLFFSLFIIVGALDKGKQKEYVKIFEGLKGFKVDRVTEIKKVAVPINAKISSLYKYVGANNLYEIEVYDGGKIEYVLSPEKLYKEVTTLSPYDKVKNI